MPESAPAAVWRTTAPVAELPYVCDLCGEPADSVHFLPWVTRAEHIAFACPNHDPGGYWLRLRVLFADKRAMLSHIGGKNGGDHALALLAERIDGIRVVTR